MKEYRLLSSSDILSIPIDAPEKLFTATNLKHEYRILANGWHPDKNIYNKQAKDVFVHLKLLYELAVHKIANGTWNGPAIITFISEDNKTYNFKYLNIHPIEIGNMYISKTKLLYVIQPEFEDLFRNGIKMMKSIKYPADKFKQQFENQLPKIVKVVNADIGFCVVMEKTEDLVLLKDLLDYLPHHKLPMVHTAWILSTLCNLACFLELNKIAHGAISPDTVWVTPKYHSGVLLGGWWYARPVGDKLIALPQESLVILPAKIFVDKIAKSEYDNTLIKVLGLQCLGDTSKIGSMLLKDKTIPSSVLSWLKSPATSTAVAEYKKWSTVRDSSLGPRKFVPLDIDINEIY